VSSCGSQSPRTGLGTIVGELRAQGGRYPGIDVLTTGTVTVWSGDSQVAEIVVEGPFEVQLPAGTYQVTATFGDNLGCDETTVTVEPDESVNVTVSCPIK
jgi:hypothetical protein